MWWIILTLYVLISSLLAFLQFAARVTFTVKYFYSKLKLNWFGACLIGIPVTVFNIIYYLCILMLILWEVIVWLLTVGHKD